MPGLVQQDGGGFGQGGAEGERDRAARRILDLMTGTWLAQALYAAVSLDLPELVEAGFRDAESLAENAGADPDVIRRLMRLLIAYGVFEADTGGYRSGAVSRLLLAHAEGSMRDLCLLYGNEFHRAWAHADSALATGRPGFDTAFGASVHEILASTPSIRNRFARAMNAGSTVFADLVAGFDFTHAERFVDVAGGDGALLATVLDAHPHLHGTLYERPSTANAARERLAELISQGRAETVAGDMFESVPAGSDIYVLSRVLQDWDDAHCATLLNNCRRAMEAEATQGAADGGKQRLLIIDRVITEDGSARLPLLWDLHLLMIAGGRERTLAEYESLLTDARLRLDSVLTLSLETSLLVARPVSRP